MSLVGAQGGTEFKVTSLIIVPKTLSLVGRAGRHGAAAVRLGAREQVQLALHKP